MLSAVLLPALGASAPPDSALVSAAPQPGFLDSLNQALHGVSAAQSQATTAEAGFAAGVPGATLAKALVANDHAAVAWNATVAVRNELVGAYQSIMNMQF
ncbi:flagellar hook-basal body complex protein FliE [Acidocella sp.]|uniref:flagellar hook-basal body complex protein FliE n=1 Tax=Acidocella sp. TaxID=50710 RepID=UPI00263208BD|nr:flagellar hook-basal body complex protein FliE [Acidocella sp.]